MSVVDGLLQLTLGVIALVANALSAFAGGGAGLVQLPALILLGLPFATALATHKLASVALGLGAAGRHWRASSLDPILSSLMLVAGLPGVWLGASAVLAVPDRWATASLGLLTLGLGLYSARRPDLGNTNRSTPLNRRTVGIGAAVLFAIGILNGSLTSGTGSKSSNKSVSGPLGATPIRRASRAFASWALLSTFSNTTPGTAIDTTGTRESSKAIGPCFISPAGYPSAWM